MDKRTAIYIVIVGIFFLICVAAFSQQTAIYTDHDADFKTALELFQKQKFSSSQKQFEKILGHRYSVSR